jgi:hypothetical protein
MDVTFMVLSHPKLGPPHRIYHFGPCSGYLSCSDHHPGFLSAPFLVLPPLASQVKPKAN